MFIYLIQKDFESNSFLAAMHLDSRLGVNIGGGNVGLATARGLTIAVLEVVMRGIGGGSLEISQNSFRALDGKVAQKASASFPEFYVGYLYQVLHQGSRRLSPHGSRTHNYEAEGPSNSGNKLLPRLVVTRSGAQTDHVFQGQRRISRRFAGVRRHVMFRSCRERSAVV